MEIKSGRGCVYSIQYHIVWCVKYRHKILTTKIEVRLIELLKQIARNNNFSILEINTEEQIRNYIKNQKRKWGECNGKGLQIQNISK